MEGRFNLARPARLERATCGFEVLVRVWTTSCDLELPPTTSNKLAAEWGRLDCYQLRPFVNWGGHKTGHSQRQGERAEKCDDSGLTGCRGRLPIAPLLVSVSVREASVHRREEGGLWYLPHSQNSILGGLSTYRTPCLQDPCKVLQAPQPAGS